MKEITYLEAIKEALDEEMARDAGVFILGEDVGVYGGAFRVTEGLFNKYGEWRVLDTPLSESGFTGAAIGAALVGMRPVVEMQFADFISCAFDQLVNVAAKNHYRWGGATPIVIRAPYGGNIHGGAFHSQCIEGFFFNVPGLKIVAPSTAYDAKGLLKASIRDNDPVIYCEHKYLYRRIKDSVPEEDYVVPIGKARTALEGKDVSIITYGAMIHTALEAAQTLRQNGISCEVIDLRTILPLDKKAIFDTVKKTNKVAVLHEQTKTGGVGAEVSALINEYCFDFLDAPIIRIAALDTPVPYSAQMEEAFLPQTKDVISAVEKLMRY
ncbi:MAG: alpha-ketoacid dehydrogenase subunit beta [Candidatus Brocadia sp.]|jgi:branched-chain alpha-keto acid dehydrogenase E1 component (EC 1.2.4.4)|uniref:2-oxoglutarate dehydrogenase E1-beta subunit n=1 Tax=Candidatus Brocadia fulgida TaxID=380242 RepID=A0A0M2V3H6_9BACT|nr:MAG: 2-oxoglutarate dehydrogenase E1-beta subunit [Candidatus Brocadia fulgida]OQY98190.1 MAG: alpha-ketoacid dehydrogenase subunit beta [Candidatus Brocadia sp. UTAMX2]UJS21830.1 MAG: alpha-ketoacid dehydrogenase subunit beta [Candidatus Brocadia sp.]